MPKNHSVSKENRLLAALPQEQYERLLPYLEPLSLRIKHVLYSANQPIEYVYFLRSGVAALFIPMDDGKFIEVATVGNEAMVGLPVFLGAEEISWLSCWQILPGDAVRMRVDTFQREVTVESHLYTLLQRYTQSLLSQIIHLAACNRLHSIKERCCRWLLIVHDRVNSNELQLTQESLSQRLGVRRASISEVAVNLQQEGLLRYRRGKIRILNRAGLEIASCGCYEKICQEYDRLIAAYQNL